MKPKLRFKEFSGDWESDKIKNLFLINAGGDIDLNRCTKEKTEKNIYPVYANSIEKNGLYGYSDLYKVEEPCITVTGRGINVGLAIPRAEKFYPIVRLLVLIPLKPLDINFFAESINLSKIFIESTGIPQLTAPQIGKVKLKFPSLPEQTKIADFLSTVDEKIQNQQYKITHLENIKKGFMQKIFSRKIRFKDANGNEFPEWKEKKIKYILKEVVEKTTVLNQYEVLSSTSNGIYTQKEYFNRDIASKDNVGYKVLKINQIVLSPQNLWMGNINLNKSFKIGMVSPSYKIFDVIKGNNSNFMGYLLRTPKAFYEYTISSEQGASIVRRNLNMDLFNDIKFMIPCLEEQQKIADFLSSFDEKIDAEKEILEHLKELKKGLLQQMFV